MAKKHTSNFGHLMDILNIAGIHMSSAVNVEPSYISKWKTGKRNFPLNAPYYSKVIAYFIKRNETLGGGLLEDFFGRIFPEYDPTEKDYLSKCIGNYILNFESIKDGAPQRRKSENLLTFSCLEGIEGRRNALIMLLEAAEKITEPTKIIIHSFDQLEWHYCDMEYLQNFSRKLKNVLNMGYQVEFIFNISDASPQNNETQNLFIDFAFYDNTDFYVYHSRVNHQYATHLYIISGRMAVTGYCLDDHAENMCSFIFHDERYVLANERMSQMLRHDASHLKLSSKPSYMENIFETARNTVKRGREYFYLGKSLSFTTMSQDLLLAVLMDNNVTETNINRILEAYRLLRTNIENTPVDSPCGFYYILDEIVGRLSFSSTINYPLSSLADKLINISRERYLQHFRDTAELLLRDERYRVVLHYTKLFSIEAFWYCGDGWTIATDKDVHTDKVKVLFCDNIKAVYTYREPFIVTFYKTPQEKRDSAYIAELFMKIANGERV